MGKVLIIASVQSHICQFHKPLVDMLHQKGLDVHVAAHDNLEQKPGLKLDFADKVFDVPFQRNIFNRINIVAYKEIKKIIEDNEYDVIHCNTPIASVLTRLAAIKSRRKGVKVIYTAHGFQFYKGSAKKNWLIYYPIEYIMSFFTDLIFTINKEDTVCAEKFGTSKVVYIPGVGVDTRRFREAEKKDLKVEFSLKENDYLMLSVGELYPRKNHKIVIEAMKELKEYPIYYVICGNGILEKELKEQCKRNGVEDKVIFAGYRRDIPQIMKSCDLFVFPSIREGLGLAGIEAMASGLPLVSSNINGILDYMEEGKTGYMCNPCEAVEFRNAILELYNNPYKCQEIGRYNVIKSQEFDVMQSVKALEVGYSQILK